MPIAKYGPAVLVPFILATIGTYLVYNALVKMSVANPNRGFL